MSDYLVNFIDDLVRHDIVDVAFAPVMRHYGFTDLAILSDMFLSPGDGDDDEVEP